MTKENKIKIMSLSLDPEMYDLIKNSAKKLGHKNVSQLIRDLVTKYLDLLVNDADDTPVILKIPAEIRENSEKLRAWLHIRADAITDALK